MFTKEITILNKNGIHVRIAAEIVHKSERLKGKYGVSLYIKRFDAKDPLAISMLALLSLKIKGNEAIQILCKEDSENSRNAVLELCEFINEKISRNKGSLSKIDDIIEESAIANEQILQSIPVGILVIDTNSYVTFINDYGQKLIDKSLNEIMGKHVKDIIPTSDLPSVVALSEPQYGKIQHINSHIVIANRSPIFSNNKVIGAIGVFQDISEMVGMKELNVKLTKILEASHDLICFVDEERRISYINPAYEEYFNINSNSILGKDLIEISPNGLRMKVFNSKEKLENIVYQKENIEIVATVEPLFTEGVFKGVISISKPVDQIKDLIKKLEKSEEELNYYKEELRRHSSLQSSFGNIIGSSSSLRDSLVIAEKAASTTSNVLIRGESGTGKELIAKLIHSNSNRKDNPFVRVNCAAIPENLLESELFGYEKGAFTGAVKSKPGKFNIADTGTIFLDEIGDMPKAMQVKLLRVLQEKEFESVGGVETQKVDIRIIAATNRNLEEMMVNGEFREDLYYRLNVITIALPPLRHRKEDINLLVENFIDKLSIKLKKQIDGIEKECLMYLQDYHWPGNIRELENIIERAINMCDGKIITAKDLPFYITNLSTNKAKNLINLTNGELLPMEEYEKEIISLAMNKHKSYNKAGKALGLTHRTVALKCKKWGIEIDGNKYGN